MNVSWQKLALYAPLLILVGWAAVSDLRFRRIPNWLTLTVVLSGIVQSFTPVAVTTIKESLLGMSAGFAVTFLLYMMGGRGAGDVKLTAGIGAWIGPWPVIEVLMVAAVASLALALGAAITRGRIRELFRSTGIMLIQLVHARRAPDERSLPGSSTSGTAMPNAVSMLLATVAVVIWMSAGRGIMAP